MDAYMLRNLNPPPNNSFVTTTTSSLKLRNRDFAEDFDILLLTETHLNERIDECDIFLESFSNIIQRKDRTNAGGGLLIYAKDTIRMVRKQELENSIDETLWVEINTMRQTKGSMLKIKVFILIRC
jgi:hypothetical protein